jgi:preprotein translocase SecE subunit
MAGIGQYLKDTQMELRHVAWPTRTQTVVYTILVAAISILVAAYLGVFDFAFTTGLTRAVASLPANTNPVTQQPVATTTQPAISTTTKATSTTFKIQ